MIFRYFVFAILVLAAPLASAADIGATADINFRAAPFSKNLTQQTVSQTFQDSRGLLWFVTQEGLNKYNGITLENFKYSLTNPDSISTNAVTRIAEDSAGDLWIATKGGGLNRYDPISNSFHAIYAQGNSATSPLSNDIATIQCNEAKVRIAF